jgi:hypothetical protein
MIISLPVTTAFAKSRLSPLLLVIPFLVNLMSCGGGESPPPAPDIPTITGEDGREYVLLARGPHTPIWGADGQLIHIEYDRNGDGRPDQIAHHDGARLPTLVEDDDDFDGRTDRWAEYDAAGRLERIGVSRNGGDAADVWIYPDASGNPRRRAYDDDGDGDIERAEVLSNGRVVQVEVDSDQDGRLDRWQVWDGDRLQSESLDTDADGRPDRRLLYDAQGRVTGIEPIN